MDFSSKLSLLQKIAVIMPKMMPKTHDSVWDAMDVMQHIPGEGFDPMPQAALEHLEKLFPSVPKATSLGGTLVRGAERRTVVGDPVRHAVGLAKGGFLTGHDYNNMLKDILRKGMKVKQFLQ